MCNWVCYFWPLVGDRGHLSAALDNDPGLGEYRNQNVVLGGFQGEGRIKTVAEGRRGTALVLSCNGEKMQAVS